MSEDYGKSILRVVIAQICKNVGWDSIHSSALEVLVDFAERHISQIGRKSRRYSEQFGRIDPSVHELEMVFKEVGINPKEMLDYTKSIDPIAISQPVSRFPAESTDKVELLIPVLDDEGKLSAPSVTFADEVDKAVVSSDGQEDAPSLTNDNAVSPIRPAAGKSSRAGNARENVRFKVRSQMMLENGELSSFFSCGKAPSAKRPPKLQHESAIPKLKVEPITKPRINTGIMKAKPKPKSPPPIDVEVDVSTVASEPSPPPVTDRPKHKPPKKVIKKKKKTASAAQPEVGFTDIFGTTLEKPQSKLKSKLSKLQQAISEAETIERPVSAASAVSASSVTSAVSAVPIYMDDMSDSELRSLAPDLSPSHSESIPGAKARLKKYGSTIEAVLSKSSSEMTREESAVADAFSFDDSMSGATSLKGTSEKKTSKKSKLSGSSRSPLNKSSAPDLNPAADTTNSKDKNAASKASAKDNYKAQKRINIRRIKMLEKLATSTSVELNPSVKSPLEPEAPQPPAKAVDVEPVNNEEDDEEIEVNVDEDSDVDILEASSPTPLHQNPYSSYSETGFADSYAATPPAAPSTPPFPQAMYAEPMDYQQTHSTELSHTGLSQWEEPPTEPPSVPYNSTMIDFGAGVTASESVRKEKHKKEKKEKKEKKKKKHKEKDKERQAQKEDRSKHRHHSASPLVEEADDSPQQDTVPRLTLKIGSQVVQEELNQISPQMDTSYTSSTQLLGETVPKLVIKPVDAGIGYGSYPESTSFAPQPVFPVATSYAAPAYNADPVAMPDADGKIWICPACSKPDDGSPMIGCDSCDEWYHWTCVGIYEPPPDDMEWFCQPCAEKDKKKKKKRKKDKR